MPAVEYGGLTFREQAEFFRQKLRLPTQSWTDIFNGMHARAFVVAGATKDELLADFQSAIAKAIEQGTTLQEFRKDFDRIVATHGWSYNGTRGWRSRVIYETNLRASYAAGRYAQMKEVAASRPYWRYRHSDAVETPRPEHLAWDGLVLAADDPWWDTHYPPNGWGCQCYVETLSGRDLERLGKDGPDKAPPIELETKTVGMRGPSPRTVEVPKGIDPGFGYNVGEAAYGRNLSDQAMEQFRAAGADAWERLTSGDWSSNDRPRLVPVDEPTRSLARKAHDAAGVAAAIRTALGVSERVFDVRGVPVLVNADTLARHVDPARAQYAPFLPDVLNDPYEVWLSFERHKGTGKVELRTRVVKAIATGKKEGMLLVAQASRGLLEAWTFVPNEPRYLQKQRVGKLLWGRKG